MNESTRVGGQTATLLLVAAVALALIGALGIGAGHWYATAGDEATGDQQDQPAAQAVPDDGEQPMTEQATFAAGCFWGVQYAFDQVPGVVSTEVGYTGGTTPNPTYEQVCTDRTGHAEAVQVTYDPKQVTYDQLLNMFWSMHDPTQVNRQGPDHGTQYRSVIFYHNAEQAVAARASKDRLQASGKYDRPIATAIEPVGTFWKAEDYHQEYFSKRGINPTCHR